MGHEDIRDFYAMLMSSDGRTPNERLSASSYCRKHRRLFAGDLGEKNISRDAL
jgi:hypothetical protein